MRSRLMAGVKAVIVVVTTSVAGFPGGPMVQKLVNWAGQFALWRSVASLLIGARIRADAPTRAEAAPTYPDEEVVRQRGAWIPHQPSHMASVKAAIVVVTTSVALVVVAAMTASPAAAQVVVEPSSEGFPGGPMVQKLVNWAGQFALWGSVASLLIGAGIWGMSQQFGNGMQSGKGKTLAASGAVGAVLTGLAAVIVNTLFTAARG